MVGSAAHPMLAFVEEWLKVATDQRTDWTFSEFGRLNGSGVDLRLVRVALACNKIDVSFFSVKRGRFSSGEQKKHTSQEIE